ncbi:MAG: hypothetical protein M0D57_19440 [Sphingobacteriales bacterium JAD_PAG50586_3]|nr:MAG: hypothetical protein M0D57_19440 [Sphingobacteriales bacterium JAD_PAG50586_3]
MRKLIVILTLFMVQGLSAQKDTQHMECGGVLEAIGMCHGEYGMPMDYTKDTAFSFYYYKDKAMYDFAIVKSGDAVQFKSYKSGQNGKCKMVDIDKKYLPEVLVLFKRYKDWQDSRWDKNTRMPIPYNYPPEITEDSLKLSRSRLDQCNCVAQIKTMAMYSMDLTFWNDEDKIQNAVDDVRLKLFKDLIAFAKKVNQ